MKRLILALVAVAALHAEVPSAIAIRNARIVPANSPAIARGTVLLRNGLIEAVGSDVQIPDDAWVVEGDGLTVYPGLIDSISSLGLPNTVTTAPGTGGGRGGGGANVIQVAAASTSPPAQGPEDRPSTTSWERAADEVKPSDTRIEAARSAGFTTAVSFPHRGIFAGQGAVVDLAGEKGGDMVVAPSVAQYITLSNSGFGGGFPGSLMGTISYIRQIYIDADYYQKAKAKYAENPRGNARPAYDRALEGVIATPRVLIPVTRRIDIDRMLRFTHELKLNAVLYGGLEGYRSADLLKSANVPILVNLRWPEKGRDTDPEEIDNMRVLENREKAPSTPAVFAKNGIKFALYADGIERRADLYRAVKRAIDAGLSQDDAVKALTIWPAEIYGVSDRLGSIEKGKIANLVVTKGELFQDKTEVKYIFVDGIKFEPVPEEPPAFGNRGNAPSNGEQQ